MPAQLAKALACCIAILASGANAETTYQPMKLEDFRVDADTIPGKKVEISGFIFYITAAWLKRSSDDMVTTPLKIDRLTREDRRKIINDCNLGCTAKVRGIVTTRGGLDVDSVDIGPKWQP